MNHSFNLHVFILFTLKCTALARIWFTFYLWGEPKQIHATRDIYSYKIEKQKIKFPAHIFTSAENKQGTENSNTNAVLGKKKKLKYNFCPIFIFSTFRILQIGCLIFFFSIRKIWNALADFHYGKPILLYLLPSLFISWND